MEYGPITAWQKGEKVEVVTDCLFLGFRITVDDDDCSHEIRSCLLLGRKAMPNLDSMLKSRDILCHQRFVQSKKWSSQWSCTVVRAGQLRKQNTEELMPSNCGAGGDS